ncbi:MAG: HRDC domain-containing protein [Flavobacteriaceae bacterium]|nr:HRDC domain-containing protein [Flavobacteriaceae bacterium]
MQIKVFHIRLDKEHFTHDQDVLNEFLNQVKFIKSNVQLIQSKVNFWSVLIHFEPKEILLEKDDSEVEKVLWTEEEIEIIKILKDWRMETSREEMVPAFMILSNKTIDSLAKIKPVTIEDLDKVHGIGEKKKEQFGQQILELLSSIF